jgi:hypothetical protein
MFLHSQFLQNRQPTRNVHKITLLCVNPTISKPRSVFHFFGRRHYISFPDRTLHYHQKLLLHLYNFKLKDRVGKLIHRLPFLKYAAIWNETVFGLRCRILSLVEYNEVNWDLHQSPTLFDYHSEKRNHRCRHLGRWITYSIGSAASPGWLKIKQIEKH